jgi:endonuclease III
LRDLAQKHGLKDVANVVIGVAKTIPKFNPGRGFAIFGKFVEKLIEVAQSSGGLIGYFNKFKSAKALQDELEKLPGVGPILAPLLVRQLRLADIVKLDISELGLSASDPVMRILNRIGLVPKGARSEEAERVVREKFKVPPMVIDAGLWHVGFHYCREEPACDICPIAHLCPKHV